MALTEYIYTIGDDFPQGKVNLSKLQLEIPASGITTQLNRIDSIGGDKHSDILTSGILHIWFEDALSAGEKTILDGDILNPAGGLISTHDNSMISSNILELTPSEENLLIYSSGESWQTLPSGVEGQVLSINSGLLDWTNLSDTDAIHDNVAGEISAIAEKVTPASGDLLIIEDSQAGNVKKRVQIGNLPGGAGGISGPGSSTDNAVARWDGTGGSSLQNSEVYVTDSGNIENPRLVTFRGEVDNGNTGTALTINWNEGQKQSITLNNTATLTFVHPPNACNLLLKINHVTGTGPITWPTGVFFPGGTDPSLTSLNTAIDIVSFYYDGLQYYGVGSFDFL